MYSLEEQKRILETGIDNIKRAGAPRPIAYRAADYSIDRKMLGLLSEFRINMDSSIFPGDSRGDVQLPETLVNRFVPIEGVYETADYYDKKGSVHRIRWNGCSGH